MAVIGGLSHSSISRLKETSSFLPQDVNKALSEMTELLSSSSNYSWYRRVYADCSGFKIPILGVHLKDLVSLNEALPDYLEDNKINLSKLQHVYSNVNELLQVMERLTLENAAHCATHSCLQGELRAQGSSLITEPSASLLLGKMETLHLRRDKT
ncbi:UNVERIFIED_CONTAM: hypothetical protein FKN15_010011 [Acipenser sinensis]